MAGHIVITGACGFLGWHLRCRLRALGGSRVVPVGREEFADQQTLHAAVSNADAVVHLAGANHGNPDHVAHTNPALAARLVEALERSRPTEMATEPPHLVFANSTHIERDTPYGRSKAEASSILASWSRKSGATYTDMVLPNLFGEHGVPFYNSFVGTFCHQIAKGEEPRVIEDAVVPMLHAQRAAEIIVDGVERRFHGQVRPDSSPHKVSDILERLRYFAEVYDRGDIPDLSAPFQRDLFNTYRSYLIRDHFPMALPVRGDDRGRLFECVKSHGGQGQTFMSSTRPGKTRGNHFHLRKMERFLVVQGRAEITLRRLFDNDVIRFSVSGDEPMITDMPTMWAHAMTNTGNEDVLTLFWSNELFDPDYPDTYPEPADPALAQRTTP